MPQTLPASALHTPGFRAALAIVMRLRAAGHQAYLAGGCVRDLLLQVDPKDYDVATSAEPQLVLQLFERTFAVGAQFGVILVCLDVDGTEVRTEVATFRTDGSYLDGRRPEQVTFATRPEDDVERRDFTINGMLLDPVPLSQNPATLDDCVLDFVGGRQDLRARLVRAIGDPARRFAEDKLRLLRAVRFAARLGYTIEPQTLAAIRQLAAEIGQVSPERVRDELTRMLTEGEARRAFELLDETGLLPNVLPEVDRMHGVEQPPEWHPEGDVWQHTLLLLSMLPAGCEPTLAWGGLLHDVGKPPTFRAPDPADPRPRIRFNHHAEVGATLARNICNRLRFSNTDTDQIVELVANHMRFGDVEQMKQSTLRHFFRLNNFPEHLELHRLDVSSSHNRMGLYHFARERYYAVPEEAHKPQPLVNGRDLIELGLKPGPEFKAILTALEDLQLEGVVSTRESALEHLRQMIAQPRAQTVQPRQETA